MYKGIQMPKNMVLPGFKVAGLQKHVQYQQELNQERQGETKS